MSGLNLYKITEPTQTALYTLKRAQVLMRMIAWKNFGLTTRAESMRNKLSNYLLSTCVWLVKAFVILLLTASALAFVELVVQALDRHQQYELSR